MLYPPLVIRQAERVRDEEECAAAQLERRLRRPEERGTWLPWRRPVPPEMRRRLSLYVGLLLCSAGVSGVGAAFVVDEGTWVSTGGLVAAGVIVGGVGSVLIWFWLVDPRVLHRYFQPFVYLLLIGAPLAVTAAQATMGPNAYFVTLLYIEVPIFAVYLLPTRVAFTMIGLASAEFGALLLVQEGYAAPAVAWIFVTLSITLIGIIFGGLLGGAVDEAAATGALRRFLPNAVADVVMSTQSSDLLAPHRRQISVIFCDLRGFTRFAAGAEPEDIVELLGEYYREVGTVLQGAGATVGTFAGDGIMAYFNDPVPCPDPAGVAVEVALRLRDPMSRLAEEWASKGFELSYGVGIAYGYATLGTFGFEERHDYTALGPVVNLASRLCSEAAPREVLIDQRTRDALEGRVESSKRMVSLKGYAEPVSAYSVSALNDPMATSDTERSSQRTP